MKHRCPRLCLHPHAHPHPFADDLYQRGLLHEYDAGRHAAAERARRQGRKGARLLIGEDDQNGGNEPRAVSSADSHHSPST